MTVSVLQPDETPEILYWRRSIKDGATAWAAPSGLELEADDYFFIFIASCTGSFTFGILSISTLTSVPPTFSTRLI